LVFVPKLEFALMKRRSLLTGMLATLGLAAAASFGMAVPPPATAPAAAGPKVKKSYTIGVIAKSTSNPFFAPSHTGAKDAAAELSKKLNTSIKIEWRTPVSEDAQKQAEAIEQLVAAGADGIAVSASDAKVLKSAIDSAVAKGVAVVTFDSDVPESKRLAYIGVDNFTFGQGLARELGKAIEGKGTVAILAGNQTAANLQERVRGARDVIAKEFKDIKIKDAYYHPENPQDSVKTVEQVQAANPDINGWIMVGGWPLMTANALDKVKGKAKVVAADALEAQIEYVKKGEVSVLLAQPVYDYGFTAVTILMDKIVSNKSPKDPIVKAELVPVTSANAAEYSKNWAKWLGK